MTSIVIVAADSGDGLADCVASVLRDNGQIEVLVVDNDSHDGSIERVAAQFAQNPQMRIIRNGANLGFGAGCNRGAEVARGDAILFLNPDCLVKAGATAALRSILDTDAVIGLIGALQVDASGRVDPASRRRDPLLPRALATASGLARLIPSLEGVEIAAAPQEALESVDAVSGALMLVSREAFARVGGFDEAYFLHCEDLDLCRRLRDAGYRVVCATEVRVVHAQGGSSRRRPIFVAWHKHRGMWRWFTRFDPAARNPVLRGLVWCGIWFAFLLKLPLLAARRAFRAFAS
jgi:N-acetylglucosaminyl-diphospho-decaprenol L-rhamnosyltransferase